MKTKTIWTLTLLLAMGAFLAVATPAVAQDGDDVLPALDTCESCGSVGVFDGDLCSHCVPADADADAGDIELKTCRMCQTDSAFEGRVCNECGEAVRAKMAEHGGMREHECSGDDCGMCKRMKAMREGMAARGEGKACGKCEKEGKECKCPKRGGEGMRGQGREWKPRELTEEQKAELTTYLEDSFPDTLVDLNDLKESDADKAKRGEMMLFFAYKATQELPEDLQDVAFGNMLGKYEIMQLAKQYKAAEDDETKEALKAELKELLDANFDGDQKLKEYHLDQMEARLEEARTKVADRAEKKDEVVDEQLEDILSGKHPRMREHDCKGDDCGECKRMKAGHGMMMPGRGEGHEGMKSMREHECSGDDCEKCKRMKAMKEAMETRGDHDDDAEGDHDDDGDAKTYATPKADDED